MKTGILAALAGVLLLIIGALGWLAFQFHASAITEQGKVSQLTSDNALQTQTIATQSLTFQKFNQLAAASQQYGTQIASDSEEKVIEYRTILKKENVPTCDLPVPAAVADGLLGYTYRLRSRAMSGTVADADRAGSGTAAASTLTYCQAVMWIDPLLTAIDKANDQLEKIRAEDAQRTGSAVPPSP
ncbi:hypothetical protein [Pantoea agglomerans]|uniref:hypothetical protein n=1 Tax=Enterobacter agglomerans TaxID=549 RepID=UPI002B1DA75D|nr:hypothetical protein [Pantoea agglomerans]